MEKITEPKYKAIHKLLNHKTYVLFPKGKKFYLFFTLKDKMPLCLLYDQYKNYVKKVYVSYNIALSQGTIFYGTIQNKTFILENLLMYKNKEIKNNIYNLDLILYILKYEINEKIIKDTLSIKIPHMTNTNCIYTFSNISYQIYGIVEYNTSNIFLFKNLLGNFIIKKDKSLSNVYGLYLIINNEQTYYSNACINDIKTTCFVNHILKNNINYNTNEYSDDETELNEELSYAFVTCLYIPEMKSWKPYQENIKKITDNKNKINYIESTNQL